MSNSRTFSMNSQTFNMQRYTYISEEVQTEFLYVYDSKYRSICPNSRTFKDLYKNSWTFQAWNPNFQIPGFSRTCANPVIQYTRTSYQPYDIVYIRLIIMRPNRVCNGIKSSPFVQSYNTQTNSDLQGQLIELALICVFVCAYKNRRIVYCLPLTE